jgi:hypothetical protein
MSIYKRWREVGGPNLFKWDEEGKEVEGIYRGPARRQVQLARHGGRGGPGPRRCHHRHRRHHVPRAHGALHKAEEGTARPVGKKPGGQEFKDFKVWVAGTEDDPAELDEFGDPVTEP